MKKSTPLDLVAIILFYGIILGTPLNLEQGSAMEDVAGFLRMVLDEVVGRHRYYFRATRETLVTTDGQRMLVLFPGTEHERTLSGPIETILRLVYQDKEFGAQAMTVAADRWSRQSLKSARDLLGQIADNTGVELRRVRWSNKNGRIRVAFQTAGGTAKEVREVSGDLATVADAIQSHNLHSANLAKGRRAKRHEAGVGTCRSRRK